jgi:DNA-directed RNA polymerase subunit omega
MDYKENLTTEQLRQKFKSQFELVNYSIRLAENMIKTGRGPRVKIEIQSPAMQILAEIQAGKDQFDDIPVAAPVQVSHYERPSFDRNIRDDDDDDSDDDLDEKPKAERKKGRKILAD